MRSIQCQYNSPVSKEPLNIEHISDHDLERHYLGMVNDKSELAEFEEHLLYCAPCVERAEGSQAYVDAMRVACARIEDPVGVMADPINSESRLFELNNGVKSGGHFEASRQIPDSQS
jgi:hypothetical protein